MIVTLTAILDGETYQIKQYNDGRTELVGLLGPESDTSIEEAVGPDVAQLIRQFSPLPVLLVTRDESDKVSAQAGV